MRTKLCRTRRSRRRRGWSLIELTISSVLVGVLIVAAMRGLGAAVRAGADTHQRAKAHQLAHSLLSEILTVAYQDPESSGVVGLESDEFGGSGREYFDDVDDYHAWAASPPEDRWGDMMPGLDGWQREVVVEFVNPDQLTQAAGSDEGVKRITVAVSRNGIVLATALAFQTEAWVDMIPDPGNNRTTGSLPPGNAPPLAVAAAAPLSDTATAVVGFDGTRSFDPDGDSLTYDWDYDDGSVATGPTPVHTFTNSSGSDLLRQVRLTVTDDSGAQHSDTITITIFAP